MGGVIPDEHVKDMEQAAKALVGEYGWAVLLLVFVLLFRGVIERFVAVMIWKIGRRYNERMIVVVDGYYGRINKIGLFYVEFFVYHKINSPPTKGWSWLVAGDKLNELHIWIPLENHLPDVEPIQTLK